jgi:kynureninase
MDAHSERSAGFSRSDPRSLHAHGVWTDARSDVLRLGPAPYLSDRQLRDAIGLLGEVVQEKAA